MHVKTGDKVKILTGKDRGKEGTVTKVLRSENKAVVEGLNLYKRHNRRRGPEGGQIVEFPAPIDASNLKVVGSGSSTTKTKKTTKKKTTK